MIAASIMSLCKPRYRFTSLKRSTLVVGDKKGEGAVQDRITSAGSMHLRITAGRMLYNQRIINNLEGITSPTNKPYSRPCGEVFLR